MNPISRDLAGLAAFTLFDYASLYATSTLGVFAATSVLKAS